MHESLGGGKFQEAVSNAVGNIEQYATLRPSGFIQLNGIYTTTNISRI